MKRVVVVGASTGLGRCVSVGLAQRGAHVALLARRLEKVSEAAVEAGNGAIALACNATDQESATTAINEAAAQLGGIDTLIYAAAIGSISRIEDATAQQWRDTFDTNVVGAALITAAALPHVRESAGNVLYMSTTGASYTAPWPGLSVYQSTKAALDHSVNAWRAEHPGISFTRVTIGECGGGQGDGQSHFNEGWDGDTTMAMAPKWFERGFMSGALMDIEHLVDMFHNLINMGSSMQVPSITLIPRPAVAS